ncbi:hypothetical protein OMP38_05055 [Cohnella ginsengisoli]|uniref:Glycosyl hydrolase family 4 C-terminal domain-containing protein n=1 Tax=Cohnella ginsengisoli TaxID=425004 RepID=A0A9X4KE09_9BACL|nr:hypothetical protein [Cohnella ginsengisoli]MDG0790287.1 hypothetical protein [Cohnella ginsengisoli]
MKKFTFIGAGSFGFTRNLVRDILSFPAFADCTIALMDVDQERLEFIKQAVDKIIAAGNYPAKVVATTNRAEALQGADGVVCTILANSVDVWRHDIEIPKKVRCRHQCWRHARAGWRVPRVTHDSGHVGHLPGY